MGHNGKDIPLDPTGRHDDEKILWEKVTQSVRRMNPRPAFQTPKQEEALKTGPQKKSWIDRSQSVQAVQAKAKTLPDKTMPADFRLGETSGIDGTSARRMQRGQVPIEDRLDLHGLSQEQAQKEVKEVSAYVFLTSPSCIFSNTLIALILISRSRISINSIIFIN